MEHELAKESFLKNTIKWVVLCLLVGLLSGMASALFLVSLQWVSNFRDRHLVLVWLCCLGLS